MSDLLSNGVSGLLAMQQALSTVSHNIANVNTEGYARQDVQLGTRLPRQVGGHSIGTGVQVQDIRRIYDEFISKELRGTNSEFSRLDTFEDLISNIDNILADPQGGVSPLLQSFFNAVQDVVDEPNSTPARSQLLSEADGLAQRFNFLADRFEDLSLETNAKIRTLVEDINNITSALQQANEKIQNAKGVGGSGIPPDLLDQRDQLLKQLSEKVAITTIDDGEGIISVFIGTGQTVVSGLDQFKLQTTPDPADASSLLISYAGIAGSLDVTAAINGGELGGVLDFRKNALQVARNSLGRTAIAIAETFNAQHRDGMDLEGDLGGDFFTTAMPQVIGTGNNAGTYGTALTATITDVTQLTIEDYTLTFNGGNWTLASQSGGSTVTVADGGAADTVLTLDGVQVTVPGASVPINLDNFIVRPTLFGASSLKLAITRTQDVAAAVPIKGSSSIANLGTGKITSGSVLTVTNANLLDPVDIVFTGVNTYDIRNATTGANLVTGATYTPGANIDFNGWRVQIDQAVQVGDRFSIRTNAGGDGDNRNMLGLAGLQNKNILDNSTASYQSDYSALVGKMGSLTLQTQVGRDAQGALLAQVQSRRDSISGVNLDEEAANLLRFQQSYQAAARVIAVAQQLFNSLIEAFR